MIRASRMIQQANYQTDGTTYYYIIDKKIIPETMLSLCIHPKLKHNTPQQSATLPFVFSPKLGDGMRWDGMGAEVHG